MSIGNTARYNSVSIDNTARYNSVSIDNTERLCLHVRDEIEKKYDNKLSKEMSGLEYEIVSKLMKTLTAKKITVPGNFLRFAF